MFGDELLDRLLLQIGVRLERRVQVRDVCAVMLVMMDPHRLLVDVRLQGGVVVGQGGKGERHDRLLWLRPSQFRMTYSAPAAKYARGRRGGQRAFAQRRAAPDFRDADDFRLASSARALLLVDRFEPLHAELIALLRGLGPGDWHRPTACALWSVRDITAHLLDDDLRRLSFHRDGQPPPADVTIDELRVAGGDDQPDERRVGGGGAADEPARADRAARGDGADGRRALPLDRPASPRRIGRSRGRARSDRRTGSTWAGTTPSGGSTSSRSGTRSARRRSPGASGSTPCWTSSCGRSPWPTATCQGGRYRHAARHRGAGRRRLDPPPEGGAWQLLAGRHPAPDATVTMSDDTAWRLFSKGLGREAARARVRIEGDQALGEVVARRARRDGLRPRPAAERHQSGDRDRRVDDLAPKARPHRQQRAPAERDQRQRLRRGREPSHAKRTDPFHQLHGEAGGQQHRGAGQPQSIRRQQADPGHAHRHPRQPAAQRRVPHAGHDERHHRADASAPAPKARPGSPRAPSGTPPPARPAPPAGDGAAATGRRRPRRRSSNGTASSCSAAGLNGTDASPLTHNPTGPAMVAMSHQAGRSGSVAAGARGSRGPPSARWSRWPAQAATMTPSTTRPRCGPIAAASAPASSPPERARGCSPVTIGRRREPEVPADQQQRDTEGDLYQRRRGRARRTAPRRPGRARPSPAASRLARARWRRRSSGPSGGRARPPAPSRWPGRRRAPRGPRRPRGSRRAARPATRRRARRGATPSRRARRAPSPEAVAARPAARRARDRGRRAAPRRMKRNPRWIIFCIAECRALLEPAQFPRTLMSLAKRPSR